MRKHLPDRHRIHVMVAAPSAATGQGGIDRVMAGLKAQLDREQSADISVRFLSSRGPGSALLSPFYLIAFCVRMILARLTGSLDVVHINLASDGSTVRKLVIAWCARRLGTPYIVHLHGAEYREFWERSGPRMDRSIRAMFERASQVVVLGTIWRQFVAARAPGTKGKIIVIPNATPVPTLAQRGGGDTVKILFLGRIGDRKGVPQLLDALAGMAEVPLWQAIIAGDGDVDSARAKVTANGQSARITFPGWVNPAAVAELIASADILVLPSFAENLPMSVIEGMAAGLAIVATPVGAVPDIVIDGETGMLVPCGDVAALSAALTRLVNDPELRANLGRNGKAVHRARLDIAPYAKSITDVWSAAASRTAPSSRALNSARNFGGGQSR